MSTGANIIAAQRHQISSNNSNENKKILKKKIKLILLPGMGCVPVSQSNFYGWLDHKLRTDANLREKFTLDLRDFPDPHLWYHTSYLLFSSFLIDDALLKLIRESARVALHLLTFCSQFHPKQSTVHLVAVRARNAPRGRTFHPHRPQLRRSRVRAIRGKIQSERHMRLRWVR